MRRQDFQKGSASKSLFTGCSPCILGKSLILCYYGGSDKVPWNYNKGRLQRIMNYVFEDWNQKLKQTFNATSNEVVLTVTEAGDLLGLSKDQMKVYVDKKGLTKVPIMRSVHRYLLLKSEIDALVG
jgi:hypothetical protein